jgi:hypothetical protein
MTLTWTAAPEYKACGADQSAVGLERWGSARPVPNPGSIPRMTKLPDILLRLKFYAANIDDVPARDLESILREAAENIETLRQMVGFKKEFWFEGTEPEGNA